MRPRKTKNSNAVYSLPGGNEDNDLWCQRIKPGHIVSIWVPTENERAAIANGANIRLGILTEPIPPVTMSVTTEKPVAR